MLDAICNVNEFSVVVAGNMVMCGDVNVSAAGPVSSVLVRETISTNDIWVTDSRAVVTLEGVSITSAYGLRVEGSIAQIVLVGSNDLRPTASAGILCGGGSNLTLVSGAGGGSLRGNIEFTRLTGCCAQREGTPVSQLPELSEVCEWSVSPKQGSGCTKMVIYGGCARFTGSP
jgi:hypothetical protein